MVITSWLVSVRAERRGEYSASRVHGDMIAKESFQAVPLFYFGQLGQEGGQKAVDGFVLFFCHQTGNLLTNLAARGGLADERAFLKGCIRMVRFISILILDAKWLMVLRMEILCGVGVKRRK